MDYEKYYEELFEEEILNREFVTYLAIKHINNSLIRKDPTNNVEIADLAVNYQEKYNNLINTFNHPLGFLNDDIFDLYKFIKPHLDTILANPKQSIIKEKKLVDKNKVKVIDPKTVAWLSSKPGSTIREKLALVNKVSTDVKRYSTNILENQVVLNFYNKIYKMLMDKIKVFRNNPKLFGDYQDDLEIKQLLIDFNKTDYILKTKFSEVIDKPHVRPNNTLIGNVNYRSIWQSNSKIKEEITYEDTFEQFNKYFYYWYIINLFNYYDVLEEANDFQNISNYTLYKKTKTNLTLVSFNNQDGLLIKRDNYLIKDNEIVLETTKFTNVTIKEIEKEHLGGLSFSIYIDDEQVAESNADLIGIKKAINLINSKLDFVDDKKVLETNVNEKLSLLSINSFDNILNGNFSFRPHLVKDQFTFVPNELYYLNNNNVYLKDYENSDYYSLLRYLKNQHEVEYNNVVIYDISDDFDEFSSMDLRKKFSSSFAHSFPVWRSVLAGESFEDKEKVKLVVDLCGDNFSFTKLGRKNERFVHYPPEEVKLYYKKYNEEDFLKEYIHAFEQKHETFFSNEFKKDLIMSGALSKILTEKSDHHISLYKSDGIDVFYIDYDDEIFDELETKFISTYQELSKQIKRRNHIIIPNFIKRVDDYTINNFDLINGANVIKYRIEEEDVTWYEILPDLSLEIINGGVFDDIVIVENMEHENIIGKKLSLNPTETFILSAGEMNYILPLNKSFVGEKNESFVARIEDDSFPLKNDVIVKMLLEYSPSSENTYKLILEPVDKSLAPFEKIIVKWEKEEINNNIIIPQLGDYGKPEVIGSEISKFSRQSREIQNDIPLIISKRLASKDIDNVLRTIFFMRNVHQNLSYYKDPDINEKVEGIKTQHRVIENLIDLHNFYLKEYEKSPRYFIERTLENIGITIVELTNDPKWFTEDKLLFPEIAYGWFLAKNNDSQEVMGIAYQDLIILSEQDNYLSSEKLRKYLSGIESLAIYNSRFVLDFIKVNPLYPTYLLNVLLKITKEMSEYDYTNIHTKNRQNNPRENAFLMRHTINILMAFIIARESIYFEHLRPGSKMANELIRYLKVFNKKYVEVRDWGYKNPNMKSRYKLDRSKLSRNLYKMLDLIYVVILYLSGDERANYITLGD